MREESGELRGPRAEEEWRRVGTGSVPTRTEGESRNAYGFPTGVASEDTGAYRVRRVSAPPTAEDAGWYADLPEGERAALRRIQQRVVWAVRGLVGAAEAKWLAEETLWQIGMLLRRQGRIALPDVGTLELVELGDGSRCLLATASPGLTPARSPGCGRQACLCRHGRQAGGGAVMAVARPSLPGGRPGSGHASIVTPAHLRALAGLLDGEARRLARRRTTAYAEQAARAAALAQRYWALAAVLEARP